MWLRTYKVKNEFINSFAIKIFKTYLFSYQYHEDGGWFRILNYGISWTKKPLFSVRNGYKKSLKVKNIYFTFIS